MHDLTLPAVFLAGFISFLSPCVLPLVPAYLSYMAGISVDKAARAEGIQRLRIIGAALFFVLGFGSVFVALGATASVFGNLIRAYLDIFTTLAALAIILMGFHFLGLFKIALFYREARFSPSGLSGFTGSYIMGLAFGFGWTPCIGPVLAAVLTVAAQEASVTRGAGLLALYAAGLGVPFVLCALALDFFRGFYKKVSPWLGVVEKVMGAVLVLVGIAFLAGWMGRLSFWLLEHFPALGRLG